MLKYLINVISQGLSFTKTESRGTLVLILIISIVLIGSKARISYLRNQPTIAADTITSEWAKTVASRISLKEKSTKTFDKQAVNIYGRKKEVDEIPVKIASLEANSVKKIEVKPLDLNVATAEELQLVKGIGPKFSERIIKYRDLLGGFADTIQLKEVYGLPNETIFKLLQRFSIESEVKTINLNQDSIKVLAKHPYISYDMARVIINYRKQHGDIDSLDDLKKIKAIDDSSFLRLKPYLK
ncbi:ComEA family DNA-binding protein [Ekhidna sp.]